MKYIGFDYYATKEGEVYSSKTNKLVAKRINRSGYYIVNLSINGKCKTFALHRLIATAFIENKEDFPVVNHLDGNKMNNNVSNLEWVTYKRNSAHAKEMGLLNPARGLNSRHGRFSPDDIRNIRILLGSREYSWSKIAKIYNVTKAAIQSIANGTSYSYVI